MSKPNLTAKEVQSLFHYDPETGIFTRRINRHRYRAGDVAGSISNDGYVCIKIKRTTFKAHRLAFLYVTGSLPIEQIDHINGVRSDNRWCNLREVSFVGNVHNQRKAQRTNKSGFLGVSPNNKKWKATIATHGEYFYLGTFDSPKEAHDAYLKAKRLLHITCTI